MNNDVNVKKQTKNMQAKTIKLSDLHLNTGQIKDVPKNPRFIKDERYEALKKSIQDDPEMLQLRELVAYDNNGELVVILGNMRYRAMKELGFKNAPVKVLPTETDAKKLRAYIQKDNIAFGQNDWDLLGNEWDVEELQDFGLECEFLEGNDELIENEDDGKENKFEDFSSKIGTQYKIEISFDNEEEQEKVYNELMGKGLSCRILTL